MATAPEKLFTPAKQLRTRPQITIHAAEYLPSGSSCSKRLVGYSHARYPEQINSSAQPAFCQGLTKVEHAPQPLILISDQMQILLDAHDAGIRQGRF